ncbi:MAG: hypothetical protein F4X81_17255 [Gammaproteobacteria bacterium]|nr:hypothetical protein [Gammaproteobacteria bacterium]MYE53201.1 hypothetical protein [Gammaproteobacteria bacterium]MYF48547.1 hypothetical protein [Gammaproteobacteria bacterium]
MRRPLQFALGLLLAITAGFQQAEERPLAPLLEGIGPLHFAISTDAPKAQRYFDQALTLAFGFNHAEAVRSFRAAAAIDPTCGICYAGAALALGPNINAPMSEEAIAPAWEAIGMALAHKPHETERERDYIDTIAARYSEDGADRAALDTAYAEAMRVLAEKYPGDLNARTLYAEALMDLSPWAYWQADGSPNAHTVALVDALEHVLATDPNHPGAAHLYIHAMEQFTPEKAEAAADRLGGLVPVAGHLVHMPSHIYLRLGRYEDAVTANERAAAADEDYIAQCNAQGLYPAAYYPHNLHFLWYAAMMEGRRELALATAERLRGRIPVEMAQAMGAIQAYLPVRMYTFVRFGMWDEALAAPAVAEALPYAEAMRHYGRGLAFAAKGELAAAQAELEALEAIRGSGELDLVVLRRADISDTLVGIAANLVRAGMAKQRGDGDEEIKQLREAVAAQLSLPYSEPPFWHYPIRQSLGTALLRHGDAEAAAEVFAADLGEFPENGWSLHGLSQVLAGRGEPNAAVQARLEAAWRNADIKPSTGW